MGERTKFKITPTLTLELDGEYEGAVVEVRRATIGEHMEWRQLISRDPSTLEEDEQQAYDMISWLGQRIVAWNLTDDDGDIPPTGESLGRQEAALIKAIGAAYTRSVGRLPSPLGPRSTDGSPFPEESIPMDVPS